MWRYMQDPLDSHRSILHPPSSPTHQKPQAVGCDADALQQGDLPHPTPAEPPVEPPSKKVSFAHQLIAPSNAHVRMQAHAWLHLKRAVAAITCLKMDSVLLSLCCAPNRPKNDLFLTTFHGRTYRTNAVTK